MGKLSLLRLLPRLDGYSRVEDYDLDVKLGMLSPSSSTKDECKIFTCHSRPELPRRRKALRWAIICHAIFTLTNLTVFGILVRVGIVPMTIRNFHQRAISYHSPVFDAIDVETTTQVANGSLFRTPTESIFRKPPSSEVGAAWHRIADTSPFLVDGKYIRSIGKGDETTAKAPLDWGFGDDQYPVHLSGSHDLHCLNMIRKTVYSGHYYGPEGPSHPLHWPHVSHCIDMVRQALMCSYGTELITYQWLEAQSRPIQDFTFRRKCRNADAIADWARGEVKQYGINDRPLPSLPAGVTPVPISDEYWKFEPALAAYIETRRKEGGLDGHGHVH